MCEFTSIFDPRIDLSANDRTSLCGTLLIKSSIQCKLWPYTLKNKIAIDMNKDLPNQHQDIITNYMYLGLLPFLACALGPWVFADHEALLVTVFLFYSSLILVFLSGALWAIALFVQDNTESRYIHVAIAFSLWPLAAYFLPPIYATGFMLAGFLLLLFWEKCFIIEFYSHWYQTLRHKITFIVVACHMLLIFNLIRP